MRVLLWSPWGAGEHYSGPGMSAYRLYRSAQTDRFRLTLAHGRPDHRVYGLYERQVCLSPIGPDLIRQWRFLQRARRWLRGHADQFDVFHGLWGYQATVAPALVANKMGLPSVVKIAAYREDLADKGGWRNWLGSARWRREHLGGLDAVIAISDHIRNELLEYGLPAEKIVKIPNGVDTRMFRPVASLQERESVRTELGLPSRPIVLFVGAIVRRKRPELLIDAILLLRRQGVDCQVVFAGPCPDRSYQAELQSRAREHQCHEQVTWLGMVDDVATLLRAADVFALPSRNEGMANGMLEAMSSGLPCIATPISGATDMIRSSENGVLCQASPELFADAIVQYLGHPELAQTHGKAARETIEATCSAERVLESHEQLFRSLLAGRSGVA